MTTNTFAYNGFGARTSKTDSTGTRTYLRDGVGVTSPLLADGAATYTPGISERRGSTTTYQLDGLKNTFAQSDANGGHVSSRNYDAFGAVTSSSGTHQGPFGYGGVYGYQTDPDTGLMLLGHRYYDSSTGRFLTRDPIKDGRNWYGYGGGFANPVNSVDPDGLRRIWWSPHKWLVTGDGYAKDNVYEAGLVQLDTSLQNSYGHFGRRNASFWGVPIGTGASVGGAFMPIKKPEQFHVPGARNHTSLARRISVELGRHLGRRSLAHTFTRYVANAVKRRILKAGPVKGPIGAVLATALLAEAFLAWGAAMDTLRDPIIDVSQFVE